MNQMAVTRSEMLDLEGSLSVGYLEGDSVSLNLQIPHLSNCYLRPWSALILEFEDMTEAWTLQPPAWPSRSHMMVRVTEPPNGNPRDR